MRAARYPAWCFAMGAALAAASCRPPPREGGAAAPVVIVRDGGMIEAGSPAPAGELRASGFSYLFALYHLPKPLTDPARAVAQRLRGAQMALGTLPARGRTAARPTVWVDQPSIAELPPPSTEDLQSAGRGLSPRDEKALAASRAVTVLAFAGPGDAALPAYHRALALIDDVAAATGALIYDAETRELFTRTAWGERLRGWHDEIPDVVPNITIHAYRDGDLLRLVTLGMAKLALPDVAVRDVTSSDASSMSTVINLVCGTFIERPALAGAGALDLAIDEIRHPDFRRRVTESLLEGAQRRATIRLDAVKPDEGDADNRLLEIVFPGPGAELQTRQDALLGRLFGSREGPVRRIDHDEELLAMSRRARAAALALKPRYRTAPPLGEELLVKAPFTTEKGGNEWMWVEVVRWRGKTIKGVLRNDPVEVPGLSAGARVEVDEHAIFDYLLTKPDGTTVGGETSRLIDQRQR